MQPPAWMRAMLVAELRDMIFKAMGSPDSFRTLQEVSGDFSFLCGLALQSLYDPRIFAGHFFDDGPGAVSVIQTSQAIMSGTSVRQYLYGFNVRDRWLVIFVNRHMADAVIDFILSQGYSRMGTRPRPFDSSASDGEAYCEVPVAVHRFTSAHRPVASRKYVSVHVSAHDPLRLLLATSRPYAMQGCDGWNFFDLYTRLGATGPHPLMSRGKHPHLLDTQEMLASLPPDTFTLQPDLLVHPATSFLERWIGDCNTWVVPNVPGTASQHRLLRQGWAIRLHAQRITRARVLHIWTDTCARCLRHSLLVTSYVAPPPAVAYAKRVLDRMTMSLSLADGLLLGPDGEPITSFDTELLTIFSFFCDERDYVYTDSEATITVDRLECTYEVWGMP